MDSSEIQPRIYDSQSDGFLNPRIDSDDQPISQLKQQPQANAKSQQMNSNKSKLISKPHKQLGKKFKFSNKGKKELPNTSMGRPSNQIIEKNHLTINRSFNDIVYHFSRLMIFLKLKQDTQTSLHAMQLQNYQSAWMSETEAIMSLQNFPQYDQQKPAFLLHPNSLHFVFDYRFQKQNKVNYNEEEVKYMLMAFFKKRKMLTTTIYHYINNYWEDIIHLVNNPQGTAEDLDVQRRGQSPEALGLFTSQEISQNRGNSSQRKEEKEGRKGKKEHKEGKKAKKEVSELQTLKKELEQDDSIAAYEIACYLHACCMKYQLRIISH